jgi:hypothetical protein
MVDSIALVGLSPGTPWEHARSAGQVVVLAGETLAASELNRVSTLVQHRSGAAIG